MTSTRRWSVALGTAVLLLLSGCTGDAAPSGPATPPKHDPGVPSGRFALAAFDSCADALSALKRAAADAVGPYGFGPGAVPLAAEGPAQRAGGAVADKAAAVPNAGVPEHSGTNTHEVGVDEPDLVKTDGRRIVTVSGGVLHVVDAATRRETGSLRLADRDASTWWAPWNMLVSADHVLIFAPDSQHGGVAVAKPAAVPSTAEVARSGVLLVDLAPAAPKLLDTFTVDGNLVDAREAGGTARVVVRSAPRLEFPMPGGDDRRTDAQRVADNRRVIEKSTVDQWLPRWSTDNAKGQVGCERVSRPAVYSGTSLLTVLTFDLGATAFTDGDPTTLVADGETVYSNGSSLYVTNDQRWRTTTWGEGRGIALRPQDSDTEIYRFDTSQPGAPRFAASGKVPGWIINQYALSEWDGRLRVATTSGEPWRAEQSAPTTSAVYVLRTSDLAQTGKLGGLGKGERIYAVRFVGTTGYVVTFRQTDPLYTVDLSDPARPRAVGELKITGYSAYLHPVDGGRLIGIGQEASVRGRVEGTQVSLFDVHDLANPTRLAQRQVSDTQSAAEYDAHAFLYWPASELLVVPVTSYGMTGNGRTTALVMRLGDSSISEIGAVSHPDSGRTNGWPDGQIQRSLMIGDTLWTVSNEGLQANDPASLARLAWVPF
jgi:hypothetical protein